ncbi:cytochrome P450 [Nocardia gipuzkoensis]|uniref:cytochrome P450 n=1 Tax=Nocardia TaxID=1817 RepID=UPI001E2DED9A|nr:MULTISPECIES: cytochrome P450 [Nocardia]UGT70837.1 cytochrome P450 [Nocardia gipuzkoensis]
MTIPPNPMVPGRCPAGHRTPYDTGDGHRVSLYSPEFAADPHGTYQSMRQRFGPLAPVELAAGVPATLVLGYRTAVNILHDPARFPADPRKWEKTIPQDSPIRAMLGWQPAARFHDGSAHDRYREASSDPIAQIDLHGLQDLVEALAIPRINTFCGRGSADLAADYAFPLVFDVLNHMIGCSPEIGNEVAAGMSARFDSGPDAAAGMARASAALIELIRHKRADPGDDITSRLVLHHANFTDRELLAQLLSFYGAGIEPIRNLITNTLLLMLTDGRFGGGLLSGSLMTRDALDEVLFADPPMANFCATYPRQPIMLDQTWVPADQPVLIGIAACHRDPDIAGGELTGNRSHLAFGAGPHVCPAKDVAYLVAHQAIDQLLDALSDIRLAVPANELTWRPGPFHRALQQLPVIFPEIPQLTTGSQSQPDSYRTRCSEAYVVK